MARLAAAVLDVRGEVLVKPLQRVEFGLHLGATELTRRAAREPEPFAEPLIDMSMMAAHQALEQAGVADLLELIG